MRILRWMRLPLVMLLSLASFWAQASLSYTSPQLNEANGLVDIVPMQAKVLTNNYLAERSLSDKSEKSPSLVTREETDSRIRTPSNTVDAYQILARAEFNLENFRASINYLDKALELTEEYRFPYKRLEVQILKARLRWKMERNFEKTKQELALIEQDYATVSNPEQFARGVNYRLYMLKAEVAAYEGNIDQALVYYGEIKPYVDKSPSPYITIEYHLELGRTLLEHRLYNRALSELLYAYWKAIEDNSSAQLAEVNRTLGQLFYDRRVFDKALDHLSEAADFYDNYERSPILARVLKFMGDIYYRQGRYNLALVHYFNVIDHERAENNIERVIEIRLSLSATYLQLYNYPLAEQYLKRAEDLLEYAEFPELKARALILQAGLNYYQKIPGTVIPLANSALEIAKTMNNLELEKHAYQMLHLGYEQAGNYRLSLENLKTYNALANIQQEKLDLISEDAFRQQKEFTEQTLHYVGQSEELIETQADYRKFQKITATILVIATIMFLVLLRRGHVIRVQKDKLEVLNDHLFTHSRSTLPNLRMLTAKLPASLQKSSNTYEQWHVGELINEPLNDRLRFIMIDVPFLRNMYLQHGYSEGLKLEKSFGEYLNGKLDPEARIYHFSDANLLYIEPSSENNKDPEAIFNKVQQWVAEFKPELHLNRIVRVGLADYPFLPRAYTAVNDKELLDILLMSTDAARTLSMKEHSSQWVYLKAIDNAPAASLATGNIRKACKHAMSQGLIKVHSSYQNEESIKKLLKDA
nr:tetratricopeptide repeat protein [Vibrio mexicanus]